MKEYIATFTALLAGKSAIDYPHWRDAVRAAIDLMNAARPLDADQIDKLTAQLSAAQAEVADLERLVDLVARSRAAAQAEIERCNASIVEVCAACGGTCEPTCTGSTLTQSAIRASSTHSNAWSRASRWTISPSGL